MPAPITDQILQAYLDEALSADQMSRIEKQLREDESLIARLGQLVGQRDAGVHSLGEIWRRNRLSCPTREQLGSFLLGAIMDDEEDYIRFHIDSVQCRYCQSNLDDLRIASEESEGQVTTRRRKYFQSSIGHLRSE
jgi:hypothetical protein